MELSKYPIPVSLALSTALNAVLFAIAGDAFVKANPDLAVSLAVLVMFAGGWASQAFTRSKASLEDGGE